MYIPPLYHPHPCYSVSVLAGTEITVTTFTVTLCDNQLLQESHTTKSGYHNHTTSRQGWVVRSSTNFIELELYRTVRELYLPDGRTTQPC